MKIQFKALIYSFSLSISLWVVACAHCQLDLVQFEKFLLELADKDSVSVTDNRMWNAMKFNNVIHE
jgi:hypothetical protein